MLPLVITLPAFLVAPANARVRVQCGVPRILLPALLASTLLACGSDDTTAVDARPDDAAAVDASPDAAAVDASPDAAPDAPVDAGATLATFTYVTSSLRTPGTAAEAAMLGLDVDGLAGDANGGIDNQLGALLGGLLEFEPRFDFNAANAAAVDRGEILLLARLGATDPIAPGPATLTFDVGASPMPAACASPADTACRRHLDGAGSVALATGVTPGTPLMGDLVGARFSGDGGTYVLPMTFGVGGPVVQMPVAMGISEVGASADGLVAGKLAGALRQTDVEAIMHPALYATFTAIAARDCLAPRPPPTCGCPFGSTGASALAFFDVDTPRDCQISQHEVSSTVDRVLPPDIDVDSDGTNDAVSFGFGYTAVGATIRP